MIINSTIFFNDKNFEQKQFHIFCTNEVFISKSILIVVHSPKNIPTIIIGGRHGLSNKTKTYSSVSILVASIQL